MDDDYANRLIDDANRLIKARTEQLLSAVTMNDILIQGLNDIKARADQALKEADAIRKAAMERATQAAQ